MKIREFADFLRGEGYSESSVSTYIRAVEKFYVFLKFYNFKEKSFDSEKLVSFLSSSYRTPSSLRTALSGIRKYLWFAFGIKLRVSADFEEEFREFKLIDRQTLRKFLDVSARSRKKSVRAALVMMVYLGLKPSEISRLRRFSIKYIDKVPAIDEGKVKRLLIDREVVDVLREIEVDSVVSLSVNPESLKVSFFRLTGKEFSLMDFKENYAYRLLEKGLPVDIVVEFSGLPLDRVSYLYRLLFLKSKQEIIGEKLADA
ncbi:hypothetical protein [Desulfurobacterium sp.]